MKIAYADPPYPRQAKRHYGKDPSGITAAEVDHTALIARLELEYPDGWALSTGSSNLYEVLPLCPPDVRIAAWVKPLCFFKPGVNPAYAWEPVIWTGGRKKRSRKEQTVYDFVKANTTFGTGTHGAKPEAFCYWLFNLMGLRPGDTLDDLYPGSGAVGRAYERWSGQLRMFA